MFIEQISNHGLRTPGEEIAFTARPKIHSHSQIFRYGRSIFCLPHRPKFSDFFDLCLHWVSVIRDYTANVTGKPCLVSFTIEKKTCSKYCMYQKSNICTLMYFGWPFCTAKIGINLKRLICSMSCLLNQPSTYKLALYKGVSKSWQLIVCLLLYFSLNSPVLHRKLFCFDVQNNFRHKTGKFR